MKTGIDLAEMERLASVAHLYGTPVYVYDLMCLKARLDEMRAALLEADASIYFATMANDTPPVLRLLAGSGVGASVNSIPHLNLARESGFPSDRIQFTSTGITQWDMAALQQDDVRCNLDSLPQLEEWFKLGSKEAGIRVNAATLRGGLGRDRIGIESANVADAQAIAARFGASISGLHIYLGTNFQSPAEMLPTLDAFFRLAETVPELCYVNIGGGAGIDYQREGKDFDLLAFGAGVAGFAKRLRAVKRHQVNVIFEPGRRLVAHCGTFVTMVTDVKRLAGQRFVTVDGSIAIFPRPFHSPETPHQIAFLGRNGARVAQGGEMTTVVGSTTFSHDILGATNLPDVIRPGDMLALFDAGAYSQSMASRFLGQPAPKAVFLDGDVATASRLPSDPVA